MGRVFSALCLTPGDGRSVRKVLITQCFVILMVALIYAVLIDADSAAGAAFGGCIALANGWLLYWRYKRGAGHPHTDPGRHFRSFFASTMERLLMVAVLFAVGIGALQLAPLPLLLGFIAGQAALLIAGLRSGNQ